MASITINPIQDNKVSPSTDITGEEKVIIINSNGTRSTISVNQILDKVDDNIADQVEDQVIDSIMETVDEKVEDRIDEAIDNIGNFNWNEVL